MSIARHVPGCSYTQWIFEGNWTAEEQRIVEEALFPHMSQLTPIMRKYPDNVWTIEKRDSDFVARRQTWQQGCLSGQSVQEIADAITSYYQE